MGRISHRQSKTPGWVAACVLGLVAASPAHAVVDGTPPTAITPKGASSPGIVVQGDSAFIGNTTLSSSNGGLTNDGVLNPSDTVAPLSIAPADAELVAAFVFWSGSLNTSSGAADTTADVQFAPGVTQPIVADECRELGALPGEPSTTHAYYCRAEVTNELKAYLSGGASGRRAINNTYNVSGFDAVPAQNVVFTRNGNAYCATRPGPNAPQDIDNPCQAAFGGWAMAFVWSSPSAANTRTVNLYDAFLRHDETSTAGWGPVTTLGGFRAIGANASLSVFALEGDDRFGSPPEVAENADFLEFNGTRLTGSGTLAGNFFNSRITTNNPSTSAFSGVDIKRFSVNLPGASLFNPVTSFTLRAGSGDNTPDVRDSNGELFFLGATMLQTDALAPNLKNSVKTVDKASAAPGDVLTYTIRADNSSPLPANVTVKDTLAAGLTYVAGSTTLDGRAVADAGGTSALFGAGVSAGTLSTGLPGSRASAVITFKATVASNFAGGTICNTANLSATPTIQFGSAVISLPVTTNPCTTVQRPNLRQPLLTATVPGTYPNVKPGDTVSYHLTIANAGAQAANALAFNADLPKYVKLVPGSVRVPFGATNGSSATGGANGTGAIAVTNVTVPGNFGIDIFFDVQVLDAASFAAAGGTDGTSLPVQVTVTGPAVDPALARSDDPLTTASGDATTVIVRSGVELATSQKTVTGDTGGFASPGQTLTWTVRLTNTGQLAATASLADDLPPFLTNCKVLSGPITCARGGSNGTFVVSGSGIALAAGASVDVRFSADVAANAPDGTRLANVAVLGASERPGTTWRPAAPVITVKSQVVLSATKTVLDVNGGGLDPGDELLYTITVKNTGNRVSSAVTIRDPLDANLAFISASDGGTFAGGAVTWAGGASGQLAGIAAGGQAIITLRARIAASVGNGTRISNQAGVSSAESSATSDDPNTATVNDPTVIVVTAAPSFVDSTKTVVDQNGAPVRPGDLLNWRIDVKNTGRAGGTGIVVTDTIDPSLEVVTISGGGTNAGGTITWNITRLAPGEAAPTLVVTTRVKSPLANGTVIANQARIRSTEASTPVPTDDPTTTAVDDATQVRVTSSVSLATSTKTATDDNGGDTLPGEKVTWRIRVIATGDAPATDVVVTDPIDRCLSTIAPGNGGIFDGTKLRWDKVTTPALANMLPGTPVELTFTSTITNGTPDGTRCNNQGVLASPAINAPATTNTDDPSTAAVGDPTSIRVTSKPLLKATKAVQLVEDANGDTTYSPGDKIRYTITVENAGTDTAKGVTLTDALATQFTNISTTPAGTNAGGRFTWALGDLAAKTSNVVTIDATVVKPLDDGTLLSNQGSARATNVTGETLTDDPSTPTPNDATVIKLKSAPVLVATKTVSDLNGGRIEPGDTIRYSLKISNTKGTSLARQVVVTDVLAQQLSFLSATGGGTFAAATRTVTFNIASIDLVTERTVTFDARIAAPLDNGTAIDNQARVVSREVTTPVLSDDPATPAPLDPTRIVVISAADLSTSTKTFVDRNGGDVRPGDLVDYTITVKNTGNAAAKGLRIEDPIDARLTPQSPVDQGGTLQGTTVVWTPAQPLAPGESLVLKLAARVAIPLTDGTELSNQARLLAQGLATPFVTDDPATPAKGDPTKFKVKAAPALSATKRVVDANGADPRPGDNFDWTITVRNTGDAEATGVTIVDRLDANLDFVGANAGGTFNAATREVRWTGLRAGLTPNDLVVTVNTKAKRPLAGGTVIGNQASITSAEVGTAVLTDDPATPAALDPTRLTIVARPDLSKPTKTANDVNGAPLQPGDVVEYTLTARNTGDIPATGVVVKDVVDPLLLDIQPRDGGTFDAATRTITWRLASLDLSPTGDKPLRFQAKVAPLLPNGTRISNQGSISSTETPQPALTDDPATTAVSDPTTLTVTSAPALVRSTKIVIDDDGGLVRLGDTLTYTITVKNSGNTYATDVVVEDPIDPRLDTIRADNGGVFTAGKLRWDKSTTPALARVVPGTDVVLTFKARITASAPNGGSILNQATVSCAENVRALTDDPGTTAASDPTAIAVRFPDLSGTTKTVLDENGGKVEPGDTLAWTIRVANAGSLPATGLVITDPIDANLVDVVATPPGRLVNGQLRWSPTDVAGLARLEGGRSVEIVVRGRVKPLARNGTVVSNQATVQAVEIPAPVTTDADLATPTRESTRVTVESRPILTTSTLTYEDPNGEEVRPGDRLTFRLRVKNTGNTYASNVVATLNLPAELQAPQLQTAGTANGRALRWDATTLAALKDVAPGDDPELVFTAAVFSPLRNGTIVSLQGSVSADEVTPAVLTDDPSTPAVADPTVFRVFSAPRFTRSEKTVLDPNGGQLEAGDEALYEIVVINDGTEPATGTRLFDTVPPGTSYVPGSLTLNGARVDDATGFPLIDGLLVKSKSADAIGGTVLVQDGVTKDAAAVVQFRVRVSRTVMPGTTISNQGSITSDTTKAQYTDDPTTPQVGDATMTVVSGGASVAGARLSWRLVDDRTQPGTVNPGDTVELTIEAPNAGQVPIACLTGALPLDALFEPVGDLRLDGRTLTAAADGDDGEWAQETASNVASARLGEIGPRAMRTVTLRARARTIGVALAQARIGCPGSIATLTDSDPALVGAQAARIPVIDGSLAGPSFAGSTKVVEDLNGGEVMPGDTLRYRIVVANDGPGAATDVTVTDVLPAGVTFVKDSVRSEPVVQASGDVTEGVSTVASRIASIAPGEKVTLTFLAKVDAGLPIGKPISNKAQLRGPGIDPVITLGPASITVGGLAGAAAIVGKIYEDLNDSGGFDAGDHGYTGFRVQLWSTPPGATRPVIVRSVFSEAGGDYVLPNLSGGDYTLSFLSPGGAAWKKASAAALGTGETRIVDAPIVPTGTVYRASDLTAVPGARVVLTYDDAMVGLVPPACDPDVAPITTALDPLLGLTTPRRVPDECLLTGQQAQAVLDTGAYRFDLPEAPEQPTYRLWVSTGSTALTFPSAVRAAQQGYAPAGAVSLTRRAVGGEQPSPYYLRLKSTGQADEITSNHLPLDALADALRITKQASRASVRIGEFVTYTVAVVNGSSVDLTSSSGGGLSLVDVFPEGFRYVRQSARALRRTSGGDECASVIGNGVDCAAGSIEPRGALEGAGSIGRFGPYDVKAGETLLLRYTLTVTGAAKAGDRDNVAHAEREGVRVTQDTKASVRVMLDPLFDESTLLGKVFCDDDANGIQTPGEGGVGFARVWADTGVYVETDTEGKFHLAGLKPGLHLFKIDERTLPPGSTAGESVRKSYYLTPGLDARINFPVKCVWPEASPDYVRVLQPKPPPPPPPAPPTPPPPPAPPLVVVAGLNPLSLSIDDVPARPPRADVKLDLDGEPEHANVAIVDGKLATPLIFRTSPAAAPASRKWTFTIENESGKAVHEATGTGVLPPSFEWNGVEQGQGSPRTGARYVYRLHLEAGAGFGWDSPPHAFGLEWHDPRVPRPPPRVASAPLVETITIGPKTFSPGTAKAGPELDQAIANLVARIPAGAGRVKVVVHGDPSDKNVDKLTAERARTISELLAKGIDASRIVAEGRGGAEPIEVAPKPPPPAPKRRRPGVKSPPAPRFDAKAAQKIRDANRRIVIEAESPAPAPLPPAIVPQPVFEPSILVAGEARAPDAQGQVRVELPRPEKDSLTARVQDRTGAALTALWKPGPRLSPYPPNDVLVQLELHRGLASIGAADLMLPLVTADVVPPAQAIALVEGQVKSPVRIGTTGAGSAATWSLVVKGPNGMVRWQRDGNGPPPRVVEWDGRAIGGGALEPGTYNVQLIATDANGNRLESARRPFVVWIPPQPIDEVLAASGLFAKDGDKALKPRATSLIKPLAKKLLSVDGNFVVEGHSDAEADLNLTIERATAVRAALVDLGVPASRLTAFGKGASTPRVPNISPKAREKNRRVEIHTLREPPRAEEPPESWTVRIGGQDAQIVGNELFKTTLANAPTAPIEFIVTGTGGRTVRYLVDPPPAELPPDAPSTSWHWRTSPMLAQAGDALPDLPDFDMPAPAASEPPPAPPAPVVAEPAAAAVTPAVSSPPDGTPPAQITDIDVGPAVAEAPGAANGLPATTEEADGKILVAMRPDDAPPEMLARKLLVRLPADGTSLRSNRLFVKGLTDAGNELTINGRKQAVDANGRFWTLVELPSGEASVTIETKDAAGHRATVQRKYLVDNTGLFLMGLADASTGLTGGELEGNDSLQLKLGGTRSVFVGGRLAGVASGELDGKRVLGGFFKSLKVTANIDTARHLDDQALMRTAADLWRSYPAWGDSSNFVQAVQARGPIYARVDADDSHLLVGDFRTQLGRSDLYRYDRTMYGADLLFDREWTPKVRTSVQVMAAPGDARLRHGHVELRATGGSIYYLQGGNVLDGSERVRMIVRDRDTGLELARSERQRWIDYEVSYVDGRVMFKQPVSSVTDAAFMANTNVLTAQQGHPVFIVVDYEYRDVAGAQGGMVGGYTRETLFGGLVTLGGGVVQESRGAASPYRLMGFELGTKKTDRTYATLEFGRSWGTDANSFFSADGGFTYTPLGPRCAAPGDPACRSLGNAWKFEATGDLADFLGRPGEMLGARLYYQDLGAGYFANGMLIEQGTSKYGGQLKYPITPKDAVVARHDSVESTLDADPSTPGLQSKVVVRRLTGFQYKHTEERWSAAAEYANVSLSDRQTSTGAANVPSDTIVAAGTYKPIAPLTLSLMQEGVLRGDPAFFTTARDRLTTTLGAQYKLADGLFANLSESVRWNGDNATQLGLTTQIADKGQAYLNERFTARGGQFTGTTLVGAGVQPWEGGRAYGEYQLDNAVSGSQNRAVLGLSSKWTLKPGLLINAGFERSQMLGDRATALGSAGTVGGNAGAIPNATQGSILGVPPFASPGLNPTAAISPGATSRDVISAGIEYLANARFKASGRIEVRYDDADARFASTTPGIADRLQLVAFSAVDWKWTDDLAFLARVVYADTFQMDAKVSLPWQASDTTLDARYLEAIAGLALRPVQYDWFALVTKIGRVIDRRPLDLSNRSWDTQVSDIVAVAPTFETPWKLGIAEKIAFKHVRSDVTGVPSQTSYVVLNVNRLDYHLLPQVDLSAEYRLQWTRIAAQDSAESTPQGDLKHGAVFEAAYRPKPFVRIGAGYAFTSISDNELARPTDSAGGFFIRATGQY